MVILFVQYPIYLTAMKTKACEIYCNIYEEYKLSQEEIDTMFPWIKNSVYLSEFFKINELQVKPLTDENLYSSQDFITANDFLYRKKLYLKLGHLLFIFCNYGKASFELSIEYIHLDKKELSTFFHFSGGRFPSIIFADLMPFNLDSSATWIKPKASVDSPIMQKAHQFRTFIKRIALGNLPTTEEFKKVLVELLSILDVHQVKYDAEAPVETLKGLQFFSGESYDKHKSHPSQFLPYQELAFDLAQHFFQNFGINAHQIESLLAAFILSKKTEPHELNAHWIEALLDHYLSPFQCCLKMILPKNFDVKFFLHTIEQLKSEPKSLQPI